MPRDRILFVDDEPQVLQGLKRMLYSMRGEWDIEVAEGGAQALERLAEDTFDVVVSDMRMPGMSGAEFLEQVAELHPTTVRLVLSGQAAETELMQAVNAAHQYLSKPCDPDLLKAAIGRASRLRSLLEDEALRSAVSTMTALPSFPSTYGEIMAIVNSDDPSLGDVATVIERDAGMTAKILQLVNSSYFGTPRTVADPAQAVSLLGLTRILDLVLGVHVFRELRHAERAGVDLEHLWEQSIRTSRIAAGIAGSIGSDPEVISMARVAGLLSVTGTLVLAAEFPVRYSEARAAADDAIATEAAEREIFGATSAQVGAYLLSLWGLPPSIVEAVAFHTDPSQLPASEDFRVLNALHAAVALDPEHRPPVEANEAFMVSDGHDQTDEWSAIAAESAA